MTQQASGKVAIIGLGLIGGSIGLGLKQANTGLRIIGFDSHRDVAKQAEKLGAVDVAESSVAAAVSHAALVIVATPILSIRDAFTEVARHVAPGATVTDTASTKAEVMGWAAELIPPEVNFIGGHPMAGKENQGIENADASLFQGKAWCICPSVDASPTAIRSVTGLASILGSEPLYMDAAEHDQYAAAVSHMPLFLSTAVFTLMRASPSWDDLGAMAGPGFRDITRLASSDSGMALGIWRTNREGIIHWLERVMAELSRYRNLLQDSQDEQLLQMFTEAQLQREHFLHEPPKREAQEVDKVDHEKAVLDMVVGGMMADKIRKMQKMPEMMRETPPQPEEEDAPKRLSAADRMAEGIRRDIEKLEADRAAKEEKKRQDNQ
jgi:prephenate dehydrogenase